MAWRETRSSWARLGFFFLCVGIGVASIVALRSIVQQVRTTLTGEARTLIAADVVVQSSHPLGEDLRAKIARLSTGHTVSATTQVVDTQTMASPLEGQGTGNVKLVELRGVAAAFPFYGQIELEGGGTYSHALLANHGAIVQPELLFALGIGQGDQFRMAGETFTIRGVIARDRIQRGGIAFGPRVYIDLDTLRATSLLGFGSRATYQLLMRVQNPADTTSLTDALRAGLREDLVGVRSWQTLENRIGENLTTAENYLSLVGFAIVVLGGLGVWSVTRVIVQQKIRSVAILKCLGTPSRSVLAILLLQVLGLATLGCLLGVALAAGGPGGDPGLAPDLARRHGGARDGLGGPPGRGGRPAGVAALRADAAARGPTREAAAAVAGSQRGHGAPADLAERSGRRGRGRGARARRDLAGRIRPRRRLCLGRSRRGCRGAVRRQPGPGPGGAAVRAFDAVRHPSRRPAPRTARQSDPHDPDGRRPRLLLRGGRARRADEPARGVWPPR